MMHTMIGTVMSGVGSHPERLPPGYSNECCLSRTVGGGTIRAAGPAVSPPRRRRLADDPLGRRFAWHVVAAELRAFAIEDLERDL